MMGECNWPPVGWVLRYQEGGLWLADVLPALEWAVPPWNLPKYNGYLSWMGSPSPSNTEYCSTRYYTCIDGWLDIKIIFSMYRFLTLLAGNLRPQHCYLSFRQDGICSSSNVWCLIYCHITVFYFVAAKFLQDAICCIADRMVILCSTWTKSTTYIGILLLASFESPAV